MAAKTKRKTAPAAPSLEGGVQAPAPPVMPPEVLGEVSLAQIKPCPFNIRKSFPEDDIAGLAESILAEGLLNRLIVRPVAEPGKVAHFDRGWHCLSHFELVDGERRFRALQLVAETHRNAADGGVKVPVVIRPLTDAQVRAVMLVTREQSRDLKVTELVAGYADLRERLGSDGAVAAAVGKPVAHVRGLLRLARLPGWALAAVDAGALPRATAELVARVPGVRGRAMAACCVLLGSPSPEGYTDTMLEDDFWKVGVKDYEQLRYRDTKDLIRNHFTKELKGAPFSLKVLYAEAETFGTGHEMFIKSCDECPKRAGNDPEAVAEGTRADVCLDPDCYRGKLAAFRVDELAKAAAKGIEEAPVDGGFHTPPKGWCDLDAVIWKGDLRGDFPVGPNQNPKREEELRKVLGAKCPTTYIEFDYVGKPVYLVRTEDARKALRELGVLKRPERAKEVPSTDTGSKPAKAATDSGKTYVVGPSIAAVANRATLLAADVLTEYGAEQYATLEQLDDAQEGGPILESLRMIVSAMAYDSMLCGGVLRREWLQRRFPGVTCDHKTRVSDERTIEGLVSVAPAPRLLAFLLELAAVSELEPGDGPQRVTGRAILNFAELNWEQLEQQARRELNGSEAAEEKIAKAEAAAEPDEPRKEADTEQPATKSKKAKPKGAHK